MSLFYKVSVNIYTHKYVYINFEKLLYRSLAKYPEIQRILVRYPNESKILVYERTGAELT